MVTLLQVFNKTLLRIRNSGSMSLYKKQDTETNEIPGKQMEIPAFLRKFSN